MPDWAAAGAETFLNGVVEKNMLAFFGRIWFLNQEENFVQRNFLSVKEMKMPRTQRLINALISGMQAAEGRRITDREVASILEVRPATLSKWRNGGTQLEQVEWLLRLMKRLPEDRWVRELREAVFSSAKACRTHFKK